MESRGRLRRLPLDNNLSCIREQGKETEDGAKGRVPIHTPSSTRQNIGKVPLGYAVRGFL